MSDPKRWLEQDGDATPHERGLLQAGVGLDPPRGARDGVWAALSLHIGPVGGGGDPGALPDPTAPTAAGPAAGGAPAGTGTGMAGGAGGSAGASGGAAAATGPLAAVGKVVGGAVGASVAKGVVIGVTSAALLGAGYAAVRPAPRQPSVVVAQPAKPVETQPVRSQAATEASVVATPAPSDAAPTPDLLGGTQNERPTSDVHYRPAGRATPTGAPLVKANPASSSSTDALAPAEGDDTAPAIDETPRPSSLHEESRSLVEARSALRRGDTAGAQRKLNEMGERFPDGVLAQEREALAIEALHRSGRRAAASARASAFLRAHPTSPHATKIRSFLK